MENAVNNKTFSQHKLVCHNIIHVVTASSMNFPLKKSNLQNLDQSINLEDSTECQHEVIIENNSKNFSIAHLNTQS